MQVQLPKLDNRTVSQLNDFVPLISYKPTWIFDKFIRCSHKVITAFTGNQFGKTDSFATQYIYRIMGWHPIPEKNVLYFECPSDHTYNVLTRPEDNICTVCGGKLQIHPRVSRIFRFASETLPGQKETMADSGGQSTEVKNTVYPAFKNRLPRFLIKKDITQRNTAMTISDPNGGRDFGDLVYPRQDIVVEFVSYSQTIQAGAGVQRLSIWCDEEPPYDFWEEQLPRLLAEDGDILLSLTPANKISWTYDELFERAQIYYRTKAICDYLNQDDDKEFIRMQETKSPHNIAVLQAATDDNPTLKLKVVDELMDKYDDPDVVATRRYGLHRQVKGRIFKSFDYNCHLIDEEEYFDRGIPTEWLHARGIDYHPRVEWYCGIISLSPTNEAFIWGAEKFSPEQMTTKEICAAFAQVGYGYKFAINRIDPESVVIKKDGITVLDDINREFHKLKRDNLDHGGFWQTWNTKGEYGRMEIQKRLKNSLRVGKPFNNIVLEDGEKRYIPTIWIVAPGGRKAAEYMRRWRWEEWVDRSALTTKDDKNTVQQKWSHMNMVWEGILKEQGFRPPRERTERGKAAPRYFQPQKRGFR